MYFLPIFITALITLCFLLSFLQILGIFRQNLRINQFLHSSEQMVSSLSISALSNQLAIIGIFSFLDGFESPMFDFALEIGPLLKHGALVSILLIVSSVFRVLTDYVPIASDEADIIGDMIDDDNSEDEGEGDLGDDEGDQDPDPTGKTTTSPSGGRQPKQSATRRPATQRPATKQPAKKKKVN